MFICFICFEVLSYIYKTLIFQCFCVILSPYPVSYHSSLGFCVYMFICLKTKINIEAYKHKSSPFFMMYSIKLAYLSFLKKWAIIYVLTHSTKDDKIFSKKSFCGFFCIFSSTGRKLHYNNSKHTCVGRPLKNYKRINEVLIIQ